MPLYEYACAKCGEITELIQKVSDPPPSTCPHCGGRKMEKVMSRSSFQLKGGGWYAEGYSGKKDSSSKVESKSETKSEGKSDSKSESSTAAKADAPAATTKSESKPKAEKSEKKAAAKKD
jgi:putative FmdB family regulatory protein